MSAHPPYVHSQVRPQAPAKPSTTLALTAILLAALGAACAWIPFVGVIGLLMAIAGLVVGLVARSRAGRGLAGGRTTATWAVLVGVVGIALGALGVVLGVLIVRAEAERIESTHAQIPGAVMDSDGKLYSAPLDADDAAVLEGARPMAIGEDLRVGQGTWAVVDVEVDAMDAVVDLIGYEPRVDGQLVLATVQAENTGREPAGVYVQSMLVGGDGVHYYGRCSVGTEHAASWIDPLDPGERAQGYLCFDMPEAAVAGARLVVTVPREPDAEAAVWTLH